MNQTLPNTLTATLTGVNQKIAFAKDHPKNDLKAADLSRLAGIWCISHGIKDLPAKEVILLCLKFWNEKYSTRLNQKEIELAFELNISGDIEKVNHYNCFSVEFFCSVLNNFLVKKAEFITQQSKVAIEGTSPIDVTEAIFADIIHDFKILVDTPDKVELPIGQFALKAKLEYLSKIVEIDLSEARMVDLREKGRWILVRELMAKKTALPPEKFGASISYSHAIARIKQGKLITQADEDNLQYQVSCLLYRFELLKWQPIPEETIDDCVFVRAVKEYLET